ncbi:hypothetical protein FK531_05340 [Rhodococcus spelaei]|uniref:Integral membrane protein n=2 Tax=Rhodococcus spelaei TaxID=2546320 RepID=A0A541BPU2_9NOCA|nr:hypothetical protein FK531_05340 [Rhodococcus spelaei]
MRGAFVGSLSGAVSVAAHAMGGGTVPAESSMVLLVLGCAAVGAVVASARIASHTVLFLAGALTLGQVIGHTTLALGAAHRHGLALSPAMVAMHALAVVVSAVLIRAGERGCASAVSALRRILPALFAAIPVVAPIAAVVPEYRPRVARRLLVGSSVGTRGPPLPAH